MEREQKKKKNGAGLAVTTAQTSSDALLRTIKAKLVLSAALSRQSVEAVFLRGGACQVAPA